MASHALEHLAASVAVEAVATGTDLVELYYDRGWSDDLPVVPLTQEKIDAIVAVLGGDPEFVECKVVPRWGALTSEVLAINMVMAGCRPEYAPIVRAAMLALTDRAFNLNGVQATTHVASPLIIVNGPIAAEVGMNGGANAFGSGNRECNHRPGRAPHPAERRRRPAAWNANKILQASMAALQRAVNFGKVNYYLKHSFSKDAAPELIAEIAASNDLVLTAIGDCGSCCSCCIRDAVALEKLGIPSAAIITTEFERETELTRTALGMQGLIPVVIDHPVSSITQTEVEACAAQVGQQAPRVWLGQT
jgi:hypothetical protein